LCLAVLNLSEIARVQGQTGYSIEKSARKRHNSGAVSAATPFQDRDAS
jgi:hypothetical protein